MRQDQHNITVEVNGVDYGTFDKMSGGGIDSDSKKYKPGNMAPEISLGGSRSVDNVVVSRLYDETRDHPQVKVLLEAVGTGEAVVKKQPLDKNGVPSGQPLVYRGTLKRCTPPDADSESTDAAMLELEVDTEGQIG